MRPRERRAVERLLGAAVPEGDGLPPIRETDALGAFDMWLRAAPRPNRAALRAMLRAVDLKLRRLPQPERVAWLSAGRGHLGGAGQFLARIAAHCYYGDAAVMRALGYDAHEVAARGFGLRRAEGRL